MVKRNYWIRSGAYTMLQRIAAFLFGFGSYFFLVRYLSIENFGVWTLYLVVSTSVEMSRSAFIQNAFVRFFNDQETDRSKLFSSSLLLNLISTVAFVGIMAGLIPVLQDFWDTKIIGDLIFWYCLTSMVLVPFTQLNYLEQANHSFSGVFWSTVTRQGLFFVTVVICYFFYPDLPLTFFAAAHFFCALAGLFTAFLQTRKMLPSSLTFEREMAGKLFKFGKYILGTGITSTMGKNASQVILGGISHSSVALYDSAVRILNFIEIPTLSISSIVYPKIAERASKEGKESVGRLYEKSVATIMAIILPIILFAFAFPEFTILLTAGKKYIEAAPALRIMVLASLLIPFNIQLGTVFEVINRPQTSFYINLGSNLINVGLNLMLIPMFGVIGSSVSFACSILFIFMIGQWSLRSTLNVRRLTVFSLVISLYKDTFEKALNAISSQKGAIK